MRAVLTLCTALLLGLAGCQKAETPEQALARVEQESAAARAAIEAVARSWESWNTAGQADSIASLFADQGRMLPPNEPAVVGRDAINAFQAQQFAMGQSTLRIIVEDVQANGPVAVARGTYTFDLTPGPNAPAGMTAIADTGKWVERLTLAGTKWEVNDLIWNSNIPLPPPPPAARKRA